MMNTIVIQGKPVPLKRPRFGNGRAYDSQGEIKEQVAWEIYPQIAKDNLLPFLPTSKPVTMDISFFMQIPKSLSKKKQAELINQPHAKRPDIDNLIKFYLDVCNGLLYDDDAQVYTVNATKTYSINPRTEIIIKETGSESNY